MCIREVFRTIYGKELDITSFGKPTKGVFDYAARELQKQADDAITDFYMIGDNPKADI